MLNFLPIESQFVKVCLIMKIDIVTIFPQMFEGVLRESIMKRAQEKKKVQIHVHDLRDYTEDKHLKVDDRPFGGGPGMVMGPQPFFDAVKKIKGRRKVKVVLMCPTGKVFQQRIAKKLSKEKNLIILCGHYEGIDDRVRQHLVDEVISLGDYILTGGELPAMVLVDSVVRLIPGVVGREESVQDESFEDGKLEYPQFTRPANFRGIQVPNVLLSGNHAEVKAWRREQSLLRTRKNRPDLLEN